MKEIEAAYYAKDPAATETITHMLQHFGIAVANLVTVLDPDIIVIGGGVSNFKDTYTKGREEVVKCTGKPHLETLIVQHKLGDSAGVIGAALIGI
jgi:fructokinase